MHVDAGVCFGLYRESYTGNTGTCFLHVFRASYHLGSLGFRAPCYSMTLAVIKSLQQWGIPRGVYLLAPFKQC